MDLEANTKTLTQVCNAVLWKCHALVYYLFMEVNISRNNYSKFDASLRRHLNGGETSTSMCQKHVLLLEKEGTMC